MKNSIQKIMLLCLLAALAACKPSPDSARNYQRELSTWLERVFQHEDSLIHSINATMDHVVSDSALGAKVYDKFHTDTVSDLSCRLDSLKHSISVSEKAIRSLGDFDKDPALRNAALDVLSEYEEVCSSEYPEVLSITRINPSEYTYDHDNRFLELSQDIDTRLQEKVSFFIKKSKEFAKKYNFDLPAEGK